MLHYYDDPKTHTMAGVRFVQAPAEEDGGGVLEARFGVLRRGWTAVTHVEEASLAGKGARWTLPADAHPDVVVRPVEEGGAAGAPPAAVLRVSLHARDPGPFRCELRCVAELPGGGGERAFTVAVRATVLRQRDGKPGVRNGVRVVSRADGEAESDDETEWQGFS